ncbi:hypothetical protein HMPREF9019_0373 [Hoylesella timonensis CRIS 5C-B1]|uniref:Uncharacterized protein n=1 Tax=Hoylesella timonensis CRIS 5C-B1 TaxID=679189 RepID=D1W1T8_9BACT|nr:hypothetical protein HMPREF9019_0373 [Hoylesella timonensis CRIS 5C-B1]
MPFMNNIYLLPDSFCGIPSIFINLTKCVHNYSSPCVFKIISQSYF